MNSHWTKNNGNRNLIVFLNGWGMDGCVAVQAPPPDGWDMLVLYDYAVLEMPFDDLESLVEPYDRSVLIAWSMGAWAAGRVFATLSSLFDRAVAVNGTARPIDARYGIPPDVYHATMDGFSEETRDAFYRRMCHSRGTLRRFLEAPPARSVDDQRQELEAILRQTRQSAETPAYPFAEAFIGTKDLIMGARNQKRFWAAVGVPCTVRDMPHYPFADMTWEELLADATDRG